MVEISLEILKMFVELLKVVIPLYVVFDICGDMLWKN